MSCGSSKDFRPKLPPWIRVKVKSGPEREEVDMTTARPSFIPWEISYSIPIISGYICIPIWAYC